MKILDLFKVKVYYFCSYKANKEDKIITGSCLVDCSRYFWKKTDFEVVYHLISNQIKKDLKATGIYFTQFHKL
ncbi:hypothetical protein [Campylobacter jejuni]|uniref:hypothetical protein n=1 Tax=Campylobacter jejuni TaxID=197 RepID=UPI003A897E3B